MKHRREVNIYHLIWKAKHGYNIFLRNKAICSSQYHAAASILGLGLGITGLYMMLQKRKMKSFYLPSVTEGNDSSEVTYVAGLRNLGNNCFLNVVLQALSSCSCFIQFLRSVPITDSESVEECKPLLVSLLTLLEDLRIIHDKKTISDPRRLMHALRFYVSSFKLTKQQDAAEALLHLLSSLEEEILQSYVPHSSSLAEITSFPSRIQKPKSKVQTECDLWRSYVYGPFDGAIGSTLTCKICSTVLSIDIEHFHSLPLSPVLDINADIIAGCSIVDCLNQFTAVEHLENYRCDRCWHIAALKYLSLSAESDEEKFHKLNHCVKLGNCDCRSLVHGEEIKLSGVSCVLKQLSLTHCPKILCIHLQRASVNEHGEFIKLQGHISFPLVLDLFPFIKVRNILVEGNLVQRSNKSVYRKLQPLDPQFNQTHMQLAKRILEHVYGPSEERELLKDFPTNYFQQQTDKTTGVSSSEMIIKDTEVVANRKNETFLFNSGSQELLDKKVQASEIGTSRSSNSSAYFLSAVVEHYGRSGSGHYAVYRRVTSDSGVGIPRTALGTGQNRWFYVSDHEVSDVSAETVFAAEASLLFYERIDVD